MTSEQEVKVQDQELRKFAVGEARIIIRLSFQAKQDESDIITLATKIYNFVKGE